MNNMLGFKANARVENQLSIMPEASSGFGMLPEELFLKLLCLERRRT